MANVPFFGKTGIEPTFYPSTKVPELYYDKGETSEYWENFYMNLIDGFRSYDNSKRPGHIKKYWKDSESDDNVLEIPTNTEFKDSNSLIVQYDNLLSYVKQAGFFESSVIDMSSEGGCHINIDLEEKLGESWSGTGSKEWKFKYKFCKNLIKFMNQNPSLVWLYAAPNDDISAKVIVRQISDLRFTQKGDCINFRDGNDCEYVEIRFLMMPRSSEELRHHLDVAHSIMNYVYDQTKKGVILKRENCKQSLKDYTYNKAKAEAVSALSAIGIPVEDAKKFDKFKLMKERFSNGKSCLV